MLPFLTILMTPGPYDDPAGRGGRQDRGHQYHADRRLPRRRPAGGHRRARAGHGPVRRRDRRRTRPRCAGATCCRRSPSRTGPSSARCTTPATTSAALDKALAAAGYDELRKEQAERRASGDALALGIGLASYVEITGMGDGEEHSASGERHRRGAPRRHGDDPHRHLAARPGSRDRLGHAGQRRARHPGREDHAEVGRHRPDPGGRRHRRLAQPAAGRRRGAAGIPGADRGRQGARRQPSSRPARPTWSSTSSRSAFEVAGDPDASVPLAAAGRGASGWSIRTVFSAPGATFPFGDARRGRRGRHRDRQGRRCSRWSPSTTPGVVLNPLLAEGQRHGGIAQGAAQAFLEEVVYDADGNPLTASFADYPFLSATEVPSFELADMADPHQLQPARRQGHRRGRLASARRPAVQNAVIDALSHLGVRHIDMPASSASRLAGNRAAQQELGPRRIGAFMTRIELTVNGEKRSDDVEPRLLLVHYLREVCGLRAANVGCDTTSCGACTVLLDGKSVKSCTVLAVQAAGQRGDHRRRSVRWRGAASGTGRVPAGARPSVRFLHAGHGDGSRRAAVGESASDRRPRCARGWRATCAGAPAITTSSGRCWPRPTRRRAAMRAAASSRPGPGKRRGDA